MTTSASRARELSKLFAIWKRACDARDFRKMAIAMRAIDAAVAGKKPQEVDMRAVDEEAPI
jgi:hypothetical protein